MFGQAKHKTLLLSVIISTIFSSCTEKETNYSSFEIKGETQGTTYSIIIVDENVNVSKGEIDSIFERFDNSLSTYVPNSVISKLNMGLGVAHVNDESGFFKRCYQISQKVYAKSNGAFDPSVFPLVKGWGFMTNVESPLSQQQVDSILRFVSFSHGAIHEVTFDGNAIELSKKNANFKIDFNAIAQGLSVDVIDEFLKKKRHKNYYIEIGGELIVRGHNREGEKWRIGVDVPKENLTTRELENIIVLSDKAIATSGNYRKFYEIDGKKYAHTLNPKTGFPVQHSLLSATVVANDAASADGYATVFMVMGVEKTLRFLKENGDLGLDVYLLYADKKGKVQRKMSSNFGKYLNQ
jgi:thiamine biosynthesis lipoprotein